MKKNSGASKRDEAEKEIANLPEPLWSEDFAVLLGFKNSAIGPEKDVPQGDEFIRSTLLELYLDRNMKESEPQQDLIWSRFCALYLPALVDRFLDPWSATDGSYIQKDADMKEDYQLYNPWLRMLVMTQHNPYLGKYLRSQKSKASGNQEITRVLAQRLAKTAPRWDQVLRGTDVDRKEYCRKAAADVIQLLSTLYTTFVSHREPEKILPSETKRTLLPILTRWRDTFFDPSKDFTRGDKDALLGDVCFRMVFHLTSRKDKNSEFHRQELKVKKHLKGWDGCGAPGCNVTDGKLLKACGRCQTVRYCSPEHQTIHWKWPWGPHKEMCFKTEF